MKNSEPKSIPETQSRTDQAENRKAYVKPSISKHKAATVVGGSPSCSYYTTAYAGWCISGLASNTNCYYH